MDRRRPFVLVRSTFVVAAVLVLAGCGGESRVDACADRMLERVRPADARNVSEDDLRRYVETTYCERFADNGWVYEDGTLKLAAYRWASSGGEDPVLDCALLHHVRRDEVQAYVRRLDGAECDDGTPVADLGAR
jgi:hypothetical protein